MAVKREQWHKLGRRQAGGDCSLYVKPPATTLEVLIGHDSDEVDEGAYWGRIK
jgi:hypothetical protein